MRGEGSLLQLSRHVTDIHVTAAFHLEIRPPYYKLRQHHKGQLISPMLAPCIVKALQNSPSALCSVPVNFKLDSLSTGVVNNQALEVYTTVKPTRAQVGQFK